MRSENDLRRGRAARGLMFPHMIIHRRGIKLSRRSYIFSGMLIMDGHFWKKTWGFLLAVTDARFFFRLQQQRPEDGVQTARAVCKLQRAGLAGSALFFHLLHSNAIYTESDLCRAVWYSKPRQPAYSVHNYLTNDSISCPICIQYICIIIIRFYIQKRAPLIFSIAVGLEFHVKSS